VTLLVDWMKNGISNLNDEYQNLVEKHPLVTYFWMGIVVISVIIAATSTYLSNPLTRSSVVNPLLIGVITLFTISLTVTTMGIQLASSRYSHRVDSSILQIIPIGIHFSPHLFTILVGILILSSGRFDTVIFALFVFFSAAAILSIFPFLLWLLRSLTPNEVLTTSINRIDEDYLDKIEEIVHEERQDHFSDPSQVGNTIFEEVTYSQTTENDPVDAVSDIVRSSITEEDTGNAKRILNEYVDRIEPIITNRYRKFETTHSDSQLVCWYLYGPLEDIFRHALKQDNHVITIEIISLLRESIVSWHEDGRDVPEVFFRLFGRVTIDYATECDRSQLRTVASEYNSVAKTVARDIDSPHTKINGALKHNFSNHCRNFAFESIDQNSYKSARKVNLGLRRIIEAHLRIPSINPRQDLLSMGLIGEEFATEEARSKHIVLNAHELAVMDEAEWTITTLVTFVDKIDEYRNGYASWSEYRELVVNEIDRINDALEPRDKNIASQVPKNSNLVMAVVRASRFFRSSFTPEDLLEEMDGQVSVGALTEVCDELVEINAMVDSGDGYKTNYRNMQIEVDGETVRGDQK